MIRYGSDEWNELRFHAFYPKMEARGSLVDVELEMELSALTPAPAGLTRLTAFIICTADGTIVEMTPRDEGCDCEFQFTAEEKAQLASYISLPGVQEMIAKVSSQMDL
ncbi:hypothetical protein [Paenibacillus beijingensis]|uniref:Uncharacterized protein n=1 Tax=Paenibacillus beijingensis TaxID=1126833 RepID=A0A0D5NPW4_9BACL|nr:hypothetical protein [Paenibacillus beijingensis]AJY77047.1 hypothetical protein VN24_23970 [Paenibacillus beijingensis]